jgi:hypothetical protein
VQHREVGGVLGAVDQLREADRIDPDVDHRSDEYVPDAEPQRFDTQTGQPLDPNAERGTTGPEQTQGQHATTRDPLNDPLNEPAHDPGHGTQHETQAQQPPEGTQTR